MKNNTKYRIQYDCKIIAKDPEGGLHRIEIFPDECPEDPRSWDNSCKMYCFSRNYSLGDKHGFASPEEMWISVLKNIVPEKEIIQSAIDGKLYGIRLEKASENGWNIYETYAYQTAFGRSPADETLEYEDVGTESIVYCIEEDLTVEHCITLLEPYIEILPLSIYDHSGITMYVGSPCDRWDSSYVGWAFMTKEDCLKNHVEIIKDEKGNPVMEEHQHENGKSTFSVKTRPLTEETWRARADEIIRAEVETYDQYLQDDAWGYYIIDIIHHPAEHHHEVITCPHCGEVISERDWDDKEYDDEFEYESRWGFYGSDHEENGLLDELPDDWEIVEVK